MTFGQLFERSLIWVTSEVSCLSGLGIREKSKQDALFSKLSITELWPKKENFKDIPIVKNDRILYSILIKIQVIQLCIFVKWQQKKQAPTCDTSITIEVFLSLVSWPYCFLSRVGQVDNNHVYYFHELEIEHVSIIYQ